MVKQLKNDRGIAMVTTLLVMLLVSTLLVGFTAAIMSDQRFRGFDRDRAVAFYGAHAGLEKLTTDMGNMFQTNFAPKAANITAVTVTPPSIPGVSFVAAQTPTTPGVTYKAATATGYTVGYNVDASGNPLAKASIVSSGPYQGLIALLTPYWIDVIAKTAAGGETHLQRQMETVAIPVFQFGMFSDTDLSFFAGPDFAFGARVHTNGNLFLSEGDGATLTISDKVTAVGEIIRTHLSNGATIAQSPSHQGTVSVAKAPGTQRDLATTEASLVGFVGSAQNPSWTTISLTTYNGYIRNGRTGAHPLNLPVMTAGGTNTDIVKRPANATENTVNPILFGERYYSKVSLRILLSDTAADIMTSLPTAAGTIGALDTTKTPVLLDGVWTTGTPNNGAAYGVVSSSRPPIATSAGPISSTLTNNVSSGANVTLNVTAAGSLPFKPVLTIGGVSFTCTGKTANTFTGCLTVPAGANGATVSSGNVLTTLNGALAGGAGPLTVTVANNGTTNFVTAPLWLATAAAAGSPARLYVQCTGYTATTLTGCTGVTANVANGATYTNNALNNAGIGTIGGYLKAEIQKADATWQDVTMELLNYGISGPNLSPLVAGVGNCGDPTPNAILRLQRLKDNVLAANGCPYAGSTTSSDFWPNALYDTREGLQRDVAAADITLGGVMYYVSLDVANLAKWLTGAAPYAAGTGTSALNVTNGYAVYFSDRRNNRDQTTIAVPNGIANNGQETAEFGWEDSINPATLAFVQNGILDPAEDVNANGVLDTYGQFPDYNGVKSTLPPLQQAPGGGLATVAGTTPLTTLTYGQAQINRAMLFRHALKLINGSAIAPTITGLTVVSENPVYVQGDWNANPGGAGGFTLAHAATSIIADAVTLLSSGWNDTTDTFQFPFTFAGGARTRASNYYRLGIVAGKNPSFSWTNGPQGWGAVADYGTDGGAHNFLRMLEGNGGTVNFLGSIATFYYSRQATGVYKCCSTVYQAPNRNFTFDTDFLTPSLLPPLTPVFRDLNTLGFSQELRPGK
jgi:hypothetical protein